MTGRWPGEGSFYSSSTWNWGHPHNHSGQEGQSYNWSSEAELSRPLEHWGKKNPTPVIKGLKNFEIRELQREQTHKITHLLWLFLSM